jgi:hypothetical protein
MNWKTVSWHAPMLSWPRTSPARRLLTAAGGPRIPGPVEDAELCRLAAVHAARRDSGRLGDTLVVAERLLGDPAAYPVVLAFLEDLQHLVSHDDAAFAGERGVVAGLGERSAAAWAALHAYWRAVEAWCRRTGVPLDSAADLLSVRNDRMRTLLWTSNRTLPAGRRIGLSHALRYERAGGEPLPGHRRTAAAPD